MKRVYPFVVLGVVVLAAATWGWLQTRRGPQGPAPWHDPSALNIGGWRIGMTQSGSGNLDHYPAPQARWDKDHRLIFAVGWRLEEGQTLLASQGDGYDAVLKKLGQAYASAGHGFFDDVAYDYYRAGSHWLIVRYPHPIIFYRGEPRPDFALAASADAVPDYWRKDILDRALAASTLK